MKVLRNISILLMSVSVMTSCLKTDEAASVGDILHTLPETKVLKMNDVYDSRTLLVKFDNVPSEDLISEISLDKGFTLEKLFRSTPGKEELEVQFGLDRWYVVQMSEEGMLDCVASELASLSQVSLVQYNHFAKKASDGDEFFNLQKFEGDDNLQEVIDAVNQFPMMADRKSVVLSDFDFEHCSKENFDRLLDLIANANDTCVFILAFVNIDFDAKSKEIPLLLQIK